MRPPRRPRVLSGEESRLWGEVAKLVTPLRGRATPKAGAEERTLSPPPAMRLPSPAIAPKAAEVARPAPVLPKSQAKRPVKLADLAPPGAKTTSLMATIPPSRPVAAALIQAPRHPGLERSERRGLQRGTLPIEARIDLHGLYQADAHAALTAFLMRARAAGCARVLVVTGKGSEKGSDEAFAERGVLRRSVPHWLRGPELRGLVLGFEEAARHHGGAGALYVRLRRR